MKILITGGAGFIGSSLVGPLQESGNTISVIDNLSTGRLSNIYQWLDSSSFDFVKANLLDYGGLQELVNTCDTVFHLAANPLIQLGIRDPSKDYDSLRATFNLLDAMRKSNVCNRLFFASTSAVYGEATVLPTPETYSPLMPISPYGASKLACEALMSGYSHTFGISCTIFRLANIIGPTNLHGVVYDFITKLSSDPYSLEILGNGKQNKSYLHIDDCIEAILKLFSKNESEKIQIYNIGSNDTITVSEIASIIMNELSLKDVNIHYRDNLDGRGWLGDVKEYLLDCSKISSLGWEPRDNSEAAVTRTVRESMRRKR